MAQMHKTSVDLFTAHGHVFDRDERLRCEVCHRDPQVGETFHLTVEPGAYSVDSEEGRQGVLARLIIRVERLERKLDGLTRVVV